MELRQLIALMRRHWPSVVILTVLGAVAGLGLSLATPKEYSARNQVLITVQVGDSIGDLNQGTSYAERVVATYSMVARSPVVLDPVVEELGLPGSGRTLRGAVAVSTDPAAPIITITATWGTRRPPPRSPTPWPRTSRSPCRTCRPRPPTAPRRSWSTRSTPRHRRAAPSVPHTRQNIALGAVLGLVLGLGWAALRTTLDVKVRTGADVAALVPVPVLATVAVDAQASARTPVIIAPTASARSEEYRRLRTNLQFVNVANRPALDRRDVLPQRRGQVGDGRQPGGHAGQRRCARLPGRRRPAAPVDRQVPGPRGGRRADHHPHRPRVAGRRPPAVRRREPPGPGVGPDPAEPQRAARVGRHGRPAGPAPAAVRHGARGHRPAAARHRRGDPQHVGRRRPGGGRQRHRHARAAQAVDLDARRGGRAHPRHRAQPHQACRRRHGHLHLPGRRAARASRGHGRGAPGLLRDHRTVAPAAAPRRRLLPRNPRRQLPRTRSTTTRPRTSSPRASGAGPTVVEPPAADSRDQSVSGRAARARLAPRSPG